ncbi:MAG: RnfABCDGE type electron transport complex subunit D [Acidobacteriota bacterium]
MRHHPILRDPRNFQIAVLSALLVYGVVGLRFDVTPGRVVATLGAAVAMQWVMTRAVGLVRFEPRSALISGLSLCLLLRTSSLGIVLAAVAVTIGSKFLLRARGKHVFNPTNFGLVVTLALFDGVWVSPGQWGSAAAFAFGAACLGALVVWRAERSDVTWAFLAAWSGLLVGRALWLGDPLTIPLHQLSSGAFLIFAFFMISDPKTTPNARAGRVLFAAVVALVAGWIQFGMWRENGLLWALVLCAPLVPLIDRALPAARFWWPEPRVDTRRFVPL